jgi:nucleoside-diphosphate kinase
VALERTLVLIKPDALMRGLAGEIIERLERKGLRLKAMRMMQMDEELASRHYGDHKGKPFFGPLVKYMVASPLIASIWEGESAIQVVRRMAGPTDGTEAPPGTIRGDLSLSGRYNLVHASDSGEAAEKEMALFFPKGKLYQYSRIEDFYV